jgi:hypothetical protein
MQNNEKLVAINERIEEAMNYRKELKDLEVQEALRVEKLRNENAENQRKSLLAKQVAHFWPITIYSIEKGNAVARGEDRDRQTQPKD